ncbi:serine/threonine protein kinase [Frankia sp. EI5c]|uniref:NHL domain-containing protein n=1 Tax=Frankia sp. EI5c TaxID=683316 RepID=UPI0007C24E98|nr:protein kinase [Frankia sp. EI5c]OAA29058.1 serine/threonine protein kinase [Frankia sp. EI5c]
MPIIDRARVAAALPGYDLGRELGAGAFGLVVAARRVGPAVGGDDVHDVAVRILDLGAAGGPPLPGRVVDPASDARVLTRLDHPHLCRLLDIVPVDGLRLLVAELLPGGTLARQSLSPPAACAVAVAVADGLMHAHAAGVLHRDVKPANILFTADGRPKLTDVGVVGLVDGTALAGGRVVGSAQYMAPEQIIGGRLLPATDIYSLAATLYELLAGAPLFGAGLTVPDLFLHHCEVVAPPPPGVPAPVAAVLARALAKAPGDRHHSAGQFAMELAAAAAAGYGPDWLERAGVQLRVEAVPGGPPGGADDPADRTTRLTEPPPEPPALSAAPAAAAVAGGYATGGGQAVTSERTTTSAPPGAAGGARAAAPPGLGLGAGSGGGCGAGPDARPWRTRRAALLAAATVTAAGVAAAAMIPLGGRGSGPASEAAAGLMSGPGTAAPVAPDGTLPKPPPYPVVAMAGTGRPGASGDGGPAARAELNAPFGMVADWAGNLYVADAGNNRVRRIAADGSIVTIAGTGTEGFSGDGGPATEAQLGRPSAVALDHAGNILIADTFNQRIRRIAPDGTITTVAGTGEHAFGGDGGPATEAALWYPGGVAVDRNGTIFIADTANNRIRRVGVDGIINTLVGGDGEGAFGDGGPASEALLAFPISVAVDGFGRLYIADSNNNRIRRVGLDGVIETVAGNGRPGYSGDGGPATAATLRSPRGVVVGADGSIYITDRTNRRVRRVDPGGVITTVAGTARPGRAADVDPDAMGPDGQVALNTAGDLFVADRRRHLVLHVHLSGAG